MRQIEFDTELQDKPFLTVPQEVAAQLPKFGHAKVILLVARMRRTQNGKRRLANSS